MVDEQPLLTQPLQTDEDVVRLRKLVRDHLVRLGFSLVEQTKMVTAASELARNTLRYGGGGEAHVDELQNGGKRPAAGLCRPGAGHCRPQPGAHRWLYHGRRTGLGLSGAKRLADEFDIDTAPGAGTRSASSNGNF
jgi:serine/threonine-protein kinase RsbT